MPNEPISPNAISYFSTPQNLGGYWSLRICYTDDIVQQLLQTEIQLKTPVVFKYRENWLSSWMPKQFLFDESQETSFSESGYSDNQEFTFTIDAKGMEDIFPEWFRSTLQGRRVCLEVTTMNKVTRLFSPFLATYKYVSATSFEDVARFEIYFKRAKFKPTAFTPLNEITFNVATFSTPTGDIPGANFKFVLNKGVDKNLFRFLQASVNNIALATECNIEDFLQNGTYYLFCQLKAEPSFYQTSILNINADETSVLVLQ